MGNILRKNEIFGIIVAPIVPAVPLSLYVAFNSSIWETVWTFLSLAFVAYIIGLVLGLPVYSYILKNRNIRSLISYCFAGVSIGVATYLLIFLPVLLSNIQYGFEHFYLAVKNSIGILVLTSVYGLISMLTFWMLVTRSIDNSINFNH